MKPHNWYWVEVLRDKKILRLEGLEGEEGKAAKVKKGDKLMSIGHTEDFRASFTIGGKIIVEQDWGKR